jgi:hypothetical protein
MEKRSIVQEEVFDALVISQADFSHAEITFHTIDHCSGGIDQIHFYIVQMRVIRGPQLGIFYF